MTPKTIHGAPERAVIWHDAECGGYRADLPLWRELAALAGGPVLDLGCGTGRVALDLAAAGHRVTALDSDEALVAELRERAARAGAPADARVGDVRALDLGKRFSLAIAPMQLLQLLAAGEERALALRGVRRHLLPGGRAAVALVEEAPPPISAELPLPDVRELAGWVYSSQPVWVGREKDSLVIRRLRQAVSPAGALTEERDEVRLTLLSAEEAEEEAARCGLRAVDRRLIPQTDDHVGSTVIVLEAA